MNPGRSISERCCSLVRSWFTVDRIRTAPAAGRLLRLEVGQRILICGELVEVRSRRVLDGRETVRIEYLLDNNGIECVLTAELLVSESSGTGLFVAGDRTMEVQEADVVVLQPG